MDNGNYQDILEVTLSVMAWGAAVTVLLFAVSLYVRRLDSATKTADEKQSVTLEQEQGLEVDPAEVQKDVLSKVEVYETILSVDDPDKTDVFINYGGIDKEDIKKAKNGDERSNMLIMEILNSYGIEEYERVNVYDTENGKDYIAELSFIEYIP